MTVQNPPAENPAQPATNAAADGVTPDAPNTTAPATTAPAPAPAAPAPQVVQENVSADAATVAAIVEGVTPAIDKMISEKLSAAGQPMNKGAQGGVLPASGAAEPSGTTDPSGQGAGIGKTMGVLSGKFPEFENLSKEMRYVKQIQAHMRKDYGEIKAINEFTKEYAAEFAKESEGYNHSGENADGGYLLMQPEMETEILRLLPRYGLAFNELDVRERVATTFQVPLGTQDLNTVKTSEGARKTGTTSKYDRATVTLEKWAGIATVTDEFSDDAAVDIWLDHTRAFARDYAKKADYVSFTEDDGDSKGILATDGLINIPVTGNLEDDLSWDHLMDLEAALETSAAEGAKFYMHRSVFNILRKSKGTTNDHYLLNPATGNFQNPFSNTEIVFGDIFRKANDGASSLPFILYGNPKEYARLYKKGGLQLDTSKEATVYDADGNQIDLFAQDMTAIRSVFRLASLVPIPEAFGVITASAIS